MRVPIAMVVDRGTLPFESYMSMQFLWFGQKGTCGLLNSCRGLEPTSIQASKPT